MRHVSLYRKWRPRTFDAVVGQEPVVRTLRRAIETDRVAHAYLFSGPRGTGKTSTAKVLAMGLNCAEGPTPEPDGTCESCRAIINNSSMDVLEMDAASNRGIDEIRDLRDRVNLAPAQGRMKVYIIDEVHMLTTEAFNALLKMLEEPPEHVVFVLATTEKHKVLPTIISRCQSFDFRRPGVSLLAEKLREISEAEGIEVEPAALTLISREARGSFRDAEGLLDQLASFAVGPITAARVRELLGSIGSEVLLETADALYERRTVDTLRVVERLQNEGRDLSRFVGELIAHLRRLMLLPYAPEAALAEAGAEERAGIEEQAGRIPTAEVVRMIESLGDALSRIKRGGDPKLELELTFLKLARDYTEPSVDTLLRRLEALEKALSDGDAAVTAPAEGVVSETAEQAAMPEARDAAEEVEETPSSREAAVPGEQEPGALEEESGAEDARLSKFDIDWDSVMQELRTRRQVPAAAFYENARVSGYDGDVLEVVFPKGMETLVRFAEDAKYMKPLQEILEGRLGARPRLEFRVAGADEPAAAGASMESANADDSPARLRPSRAIFEATPDMVPEPEVNPPRGGAAEGTEAEGVPVVEAGEEAGADDVIRDSDEVLDMAREFFGSGGNLSNDKQNGGR